MALELTWDAYSKVSRQGLESYEYLSDFIDGPIPKNPQLLKKPTVNLLMVRDHDGQSYIDYWDDGIGIGKIYLPKLYTLGNSIGDKLLMSEVGFGLKVATFAMGRLVYLYSKQVGKDCYKLAPTDGTEYFGQNKDDIADMGTVDDLVQENHSLIKQSGTHFRLTEVDEKLPIFKKEDSFRRYCKKFEGMYYNFLGTYLDLNIIYKDKIRNVTYEHNCKSYPPLMSNPRETLDVDLKLGKNTPIVDGKNIPIPGYPELRVTLTAWHKPTLDQVREYYDKTGDETYNPIDYKNSPWIYGRANTGIALSKRGKILKFGVDRKSSRTERSGIIVDIEGLKSTMVKTGYEKGAQYDAILEEVNNLLKSDAVKFFRRTKAGTSGRTEAEDQDKFVTDILYSDDAWKKKYNIKDPKLQIKQYVRNDVGECDIVIFDYDDMMKDIETVTAVGECKEDHGGGEQARQLIGYLDHYKINKGFFVSQIKNASFDSQVNDSSEMRTEKLEIDYFDSNRLY